MRCVLDDSVRPFSLDADVRYISYSPWEATLLCYLVLHIVVDEERLGKNCRCSVLRLRLCPSAHVFFTLNEVSDVFPCGDVFDKTLTSRLQ
mmetsp:Transcript_2723/g.3080  ORF Transcript_2723/g.3080 Transcript_2723/m.3080 type:complete len:91 (-) Transcript_2723:1250-1522(-)